MEELAKRVLNANSEKSEKVSSVMEKTIRLNNIQRKESFDELIKNDEFCTTGRELVDEIQSIPDDDRKQITSAYEWFFTRLTMVLSVTKGKTNES